MLRLSGSHCSQQKMRMLTKHTTVLGMGVCDSDYGILWPWLVTCSLDLKACFCPGLLANSQMSGNHNFFPAVISK